MTDAEFIEDIGKGLAADEHAQSESVSEKITRAVEWSNENPNGDVLALKASATRAKDFHDYEYALAAVLENAWSRAAKKTKAIIEDGLLLTSTKAAGDAPDLSRLDAVMDSAATVMSAAITEEDEERIRKITRRAVQRGVALARTGYALDDLPRFATIMDGMVQASKYFTNRYFSEQVMPKLYQAIEDAIQTGTAPTSEAVKAVRAALDARLAGRTPYWQTVANAATSRAYHYGVVKAGRASGYRGYRLVATLDSNTSDVCRSLHQREYWLADAETVVERVASLEDPGDIRSAHPWIEKEEAKALTDDQVYARAVYVPPFHGNCRTVMELIPF